MSGVELYHKRLNFIKGDSFTWRGKEWTFYSHPVENVTDVAGYIETTTEDFNLKVHDIHSDGIAIKGSAPRQFKKGGIVTRLLNGLLSKRENVKAFVKFSEMRGL